MDGNYSESPPGGSTVIDYHVKLIGILPHDHFEKDISPGDDDEEPSEAQGHGSQKGQLGRWNVEHLPVCKVPSKQTWYSGPPVDLAGHPTLIGSGLLERKYGLSVEIPSLKLKVNIDPEAEATLEDEDNYSPDGDTSMITNTNGFGQLGLYTTLENDPNKEAREKKANIFFKDASIKVFGDESESPGLVGSYALRFLQVNYAPGDVFPDLTCERIALHKMMTSPELFALKAQKHKWFVKEEGDRLRQVSTVDISLKLLKMTGDESCLGSRFGRMMISNSLPSKSQTPAHEVQEATEPSGKYHYHGHFQSCISKVNCAHRNVTRSINVNFVAGIDGVWEKKENPSLYTCKDLAELKTAKRETVCPTSGYPHFYKQIRMKENWTQCHLVGIEKYMVGINGPSVSDPLRRELQELWLYETDRVPQAAYIAGKEDDFKVWYPQEIMEKLFGNLELILDSVHASGEDEEAYFFHYNGEDFLVAFTKDDFLEEVELLKVAQRTITVRNLPEPSLNVDHESIMSASKELLEKFIESVLLHATEPVKPNPEIDLKNPREPQLIFQTINEAKSFLRLAKYLHRNGKLPTEFDKVFFEMSRTPNHEEARLAARRLPRRRYSSTTGDHQYQWGSYSSQHSGSFSHGASPYSPTPRSLNSNSTSRFQQRTPGGHRSSNDRNYRSPSSEADQNANWRAA